MEENRTYTVEEVRFLIDYTQSIVFDAVQNTLRKNKSPFEDTSKKLLRKWGQLYAFPDIILEKRKRTGLASTTFPLNINQREVLYRILGNTSNRITSLDDIDLIIETLKQLRDYEC